jgi:phosphohistidine phosphatase
MTKPEMNRLILIRHGEAEQSSPSGRDFDRRLTMHGVREAAAMGETLARLGLAPDFAIVSSAARARETWAALADAFPAARFRYEDKLYNAEPATLRRLIADADGSGAAVMVVAHNPGLQELAADLLGQSSADETLLARMRTHFPTAAAAVYAIGEEGEVRPEGLFLPKDRNAP